jgi:hypothetical protein
VRSTTAALALVLAGVGAARFGYVLHGADLREGEPLAYLVPAALAFGGSAYALASASDGAAALVVRRSGWGLMTAALLVPSTFTLALPVTPLLLLTLLRSPTPESTVGRTAR